MEREIEQQQQQIRLLNRAALDAKSPSKAANAVRVCPPPPRPAVGTTGNWEKRDKCSWGGGRSATQPTVG